MRHRAPIAGIAAHGGFIATAGYDNRVILWDAGTRRALARGSHDHLVNDCAFSTDGRWLVSSSSDYSARVWAVPSMRLHAVLGGHRDDVDMAAFSPDDRHIATCALDRCVRVFDRDGRCLHEMRGHTGNVLSLAWSANENELVTSSVDGTVRLWNVESGQCVRSTDLGVRTDSVEIDADGVVYAGDDRGRIAIVDAGRATFVDAHHAGIKKIALDARSKVLVSLSYDRSMAVWRIGGPGRLEVSNRSVLPELVWARAAAVLDDGRIATGTFGSTYALFDTQASSWDLEGVVAGVAVNAVLKVDARVYSVGDAGVVSIDHQPTAETGSLCNFLVSAGGRVFTGGQMGRLFDADSGAVVHEHHSPLNCGVAFHRHGALHLAIGSYTGEILVFRLGVGATPSLLTVLQPYENAVKGLSCGDGLLFSVCASTDIAWHRLEDWSLAARVDKAHERIANACCAIGPHGFASVGRDRALRIWGPEGIETHPSPHLHSVKCLAADDEHRSVLTGSYGGTLALFDLVEKRWTELHRPTDAGVSSIAWDGGARRFLAASYDGGIYTVQR
jgi:WD40 repeat protein